ncbi:MAG: ABC transporter permease [Deltaproteobacteria bacterium]|nr:ABC transporter permease [Deltaproteobacteria bacterium]
MVNWRGLYTLFAKEVWRFVKVAVQTILTPVVTVMLYLLIFSSVLSEKVEVYQGTNYTTFLVPGLIMMSMIQNAFANSSSSLFQSKLNGSIAFVLLAPISNLEFYAASNLPVLLGFAVLGTGILGTLGLIASIWAEKWDHISAFQNFVILPLSFLSGVFYSIRSLPEFWQKISYYNPFFYMIDGFRYGFLGVSDISVWISMGIVGAFFVTVSLVCLLLLRSGYSLRG